MLTGRAYDWRTLSTPEVFQMRRTWPFVMLTFGSSLALSGCTTSTDACFHIEYGDCSGGGGSAARTFIVGVDSARVDFSTTVASGGFRAVIHIGDTPRLHL